MPNAGNFYAEIPVVVENLDHCFGTDEIDFSCGSGNKLAICSEIAGVNLRDFDVFFENFHSVSTGGLPRELQVEVKQ